MRPQENRPALTVGVLRRLSRETKAIATSPVPCEEAERRYNRARKAKWFKPIVESLNEWAGPGARCMYCSGSESAEVEHFKPKSVFPKEALIWENLLWTCGVCNRFKGDRFPPTTEQGESLINPGIECVWDFFFIDEFGNLTPLWRDDENLLDRRATITENILKLNRQALQEARQSSLCDLRQKVEDVLALHSAGKLTPQDIARRIKQWLIQPFQPDVAHYFLIGPGRNEKPYKDLILLVKNVGNEEER
jgi:5-methylcytosine-specific restriction endonuclease McrA